MHCRHCTDIVIVAADVGVEYHFGDGLALAEANAKPINNPFDTRFILALLCRNISLDHNLAFLNFQSFTSRP